MQLKAYKRPSTLLIGVLVQNLPLGKVLKCTGIDVLMYPHFWSLCHLSIIDWLVVCYCHGHPHWGCPYTSQECPGSATILPTSMTSGGLPSPQLVFVCTVLIEQISLHLENGIVTRVPPCCLREHPSQLLASLGGCPSHLLASLGGHQLSTNGPNHVSCSASVATRVIKCSCGKEEDQ